MNKFRLSVEDLRYAAHDVWDRSRNPRRVTTAVFAGFIMLADSTLDLLGDKASPARSDQEITAVAFSTWKSALENASPADQYALQYLGGVEVDVDETENRGSGVLGIFTQGYTQSISVGNDCLGDTAYDTNGGQFNISVDGLLNHTRIVGSTPTAIAAVSTTENESIVVSSGANSPLTFIRSDGFLAPANDSTTSTLRAYGCVEDPREAVG